MNANAPTARAESRDRSRQQVATAPRATEGKRVNLKTYQAYTMAQALAAVKHRVQGVYVMPPFNRVDSALAVLEVARDRWKP